MDHCTRSIRVNLTPSRISPHGLGQPDVYFIADPRGWYGYGFPCRTPPCSPAPTALPGAASGVRARCECCCCCCCCCCCSICDMFCNPTHLGDVASHPKTERRDRHRDGNVSQLTIGIAVGVSCQRSCRMVRSCTLYCCLLLLCLLHHRDRQRFVPSIDSTDCCPTVLYLYTQYARQAYEGSRSTELLLLRYERFMRCCVGWRMADGSMCYFLCSQCSLSLHSIIYAVPLGSTAAL